MTEQERSLTPPIAPFLLELLDCLCEHVDQYGQGPVCWCGIYPGSQVSWEYCGECSSGTCGMAYVRPGTAQPYNTFPIGELDATCASPIFHNIEVGIVRCLPTAEDDGSLPDAKELTEAALGMVHDQFALHRAIRCCEYVKPATLAVETWQPVGPSGGCHGGYWTLFVDPA